jgi:hypothetical protein
VVALSWAEPVMKFVHSMHFLDSTTTILPFDIGRAIGLIILAFAVGYIVGFIFSSAWNMFHKGMV